MERFGEDLPETARRDLEKLQGPGTPALTSPSPHQGRGGAACEVCKWGGSKEPPAPRRPPPFEGAKVAASSKVPLVGWGLSNLPSSNFGTVR